MAKKINNPKQTLIDIEHNDTEEHPMTFGMAEFKRIICYLCDHVYDSDNYNVVVDRNGHFQFKDVGNNDLQIFSINGGYLYFKFYIPEEENEDHR